MGLIHLPPSLFACPVCQSAPDVARGVGPGQEMLDFAILADHLLLLAVACMHVYRHLVLRGSLLLNISFVIRYHLVVPINHQSTEVSVAPLETVNTRSPSWWLYINRAQSTSLDQVRKGTEPICVDSVNRRMGTYLVC